MYDFCDNVHVNREKLLESHQKATADRIKKEKVVLAVQDTTYVDDTHHLCTEGLGSWSDKNHRGILLHTTLAVTPERVALGRIDQQIIYRNPEEQGKSEPRKKASDRRERKLHMVNQSGTSSETPHRRL